MVERESQRKPLIPGPILSLLYHESFHPAEASEQMPHAATLTKLCFSDLRLFLKSLLPSDISVQKALGKATLICNTYKYSSSIS